MKIPKNIADNYNKPVKNPQHFTDKFGFIKESPQTYSYNQNWCDNDLEKKIWKGIPVIYKYKIWSELVKKKKGYTNCIENSNCINLNNKNIPENINHIDINNNNDIGNNENNLINIGDISQRNLDNNLMDNNNLMDINNLQPQITNDVFSLNSNTASSFSMLDYNHIKTLPTPFDHQIHIDIQRTFRSHSLFSLQYGPGQSRLFNTLRAFAVLHPEIGYCQGMSSFFGLVLMYFPEREGFYLLENIIRYNNLYSLFDSKLSGLENVNSIVNDILCRLEPGIFEKVKGMEVFYVSWFLTLFSRFEIELALRLWDIFLYYDFVVLLYAVPAILKVGLEKHNSKLIKGEMKSILSGLENSGLDLSKVIWVMRGYVKKEWERIREYRKILGIRV